VVLPSPPCVSASSYNHIVLPAVAGGDTKSEHGIRSHFSIFLKINNVNLTLLASLKK
jgi:hypothetical protein